MGQVRDQVVYGERGRTSMPFVMQPEWIGAAAISAGAKQAWTTYQQHVNHLRAHRGDRVVWPSQKRMCRVLRITPKTLKKYNDELVSITALEVRQGRSPNNPMRRQNTYVVHELPDPSYEGPMTFDDLPDA